MAFDSSFLLQVNLGLSILYARRALGTILANWSVSGPRISAELLNCEEHNLALVLDVLNRDTSNLKQFEKVNSEWCVLYYQKIQCIEGYVVLEYRQKSPQFNN